MDWAYWVMNGKVPTLVQFQLEVLMKYKSAFARL